MIRQIVYHLPNFAKCGKVTILKCITETTCQCCNDLTNSCLFWQIWQTSCSVTKTLEFYTKSNISMDVCIKCHRVFNIFMEVQFIGQNHKLVLFFSSLFIEVFSYWNPVSLEKRPKCWSDSYLWNHELEIRITSRPFLPGWQVDRLPGFHFEEPLMIDCGRFQYPRVNWNGHLEPYTTDTTFQIKVLVNGRLWNHYLKSMT